jgi:hypothetical protein
VTDVVPTSAQAWQSKEEDLAKAKDVIVGDVPTIAETPENRIVLPRGISANGKWNATCEVRELTGVDEEALAKARKADETFDLMLVRGVTRVGELDLSRMDSGESRGWLGKLLIGEREMLFLAIAKATYGDERKYEYKCKDCGLAQTLTVRISEDFKPQEIPDIREKAFSYTTTKGQKITYRLATGDDQAEVLRKQGATTAEMNTTLLSSCITEVDGTLVVDPMFFARSLSMRDRQAILSDMVAHQPTINLLVEFPCDGCGEGQQVTFGWLDFFRP